MSFIRERRKRIQQGYVLKDVMGCKNISELNKLVKPEPEPIPEPAEEENAEPTI